jgi:hypothetical protein
LGFEVKPSTKKNLKFLSRNRESCHLFQAIVNHLTVSGGGGAKARTFTTAESSALCLLVCRVFRVFKGF